MIIMAVSRERYFVKLLLILCCSSTTVIICQSQGFTCFSSIDCHGNAVDGDISMISECCTIGAGLSFEEGTGKCGNCFTEEKFEGQGEKFYLSIFSNYEPSEYFRIGRIRLAVEPVGRESTTFMVDALGDQTVYTAPDEVTLDSRMLELESVGTRNKGIFIKSETGDPLSVVAFVEEFQSSDTFKVYPCVAQPVTAYEYYAVSIPQSFIVLPPDPDYPQDEQEVLDPQGNSAIVIVTTEENTVLNVTLTQDVSISEARDIVEQIGTDLLRSGEEASFQLSAKGATLYLASLDDLTGSRVASNKPIAFITGHECGTLPHNIQYCDHLVEQITPTSTWGKEFIISTIATRREVDTFRIIVSRSDTSVSVACTITDVPPLNLSMAGSYVEFHVNSNDSCYLGSNQPILVAQFSVSSLVDEVSDSDPFLVIVPPIEQYRSSYVFNTFSGSPFNPGENYINILLPAGVELEGLRLDGETLPDDATVTSIQCPDSDTVCATTVQVRVSDDRHDLNHIDSSAQFSAIVYWLSFRVAHGYPIGMTQNPIALPSVSLERSDYIVFENDSAVVLQLTREGDTSVPATVFVSTAEISNGGNALSGDDFVAVSQLAVNFGENQKQAFVSIDIVDDVFPESTEEFEVFLSASPGVYIVSPAYANVTIFNDDPPLPVMNVSFAETNIEVLEGLGLLMLTLEKTMGAIGPVAVQVFTSSDSAVDGEDFVVIDDIITFEIEDLMVIVDVLVLDNLSLEDIEQFTVHIEPVVGDFPVAVQNSTSTVSIRDNDVVVLGFEQPTYTVSEENDGEFRVSVIISHGSLQRTIIATVETISGSAIEAEDFVPVTRVLSFDSTTTEQSISVSLINDNQVEVNEEFNVRLVLEEEDSSNIIVSPVEAIVTITDADRVEIDLLPVATTVREGEGSARVNVSVMEGRLGGPVSVTLTTFNINSTGGEDYTEVSTEITLSPSNSFQEVLIPITDDTVYDGPEHEKFLITATLMPDQNTERVDVQVSSQTITIVDNEPRPIALVGFSEASYTTVEDAQVIVLLVESDGINYDLITVDFFYQTGEAQDDSDIIFSNGSLQFPPGSRTGVITVPIVDDGIAELAETFTVRLRSRVPDPITLITDSATVTIIDNDVVDVGFGQMVYSVTEGQNAEIVLTITKTTLTDRTVSVMFSTLDGTALAGVDYELLTQALTFPPNVNSREVTVRILNNQRQEPGSRFFFGELRSVSSTDVNISLPTASILITDDDLTDIPSRPINFEASPQATAVVLTWEQPPVDMVDIYVLMWTYLSPCERGSPQSVLLDGATRQYTLEDLEEDSTYSFRLQARNSAGVGPDAVLEVTTLTAAPSGPPQSLRGVSTTPTSITIEWNDIICLDQNGAITSYDVRLNGRVALTTFQRQATITGLSSSTSYFIDVRGNNLIGGGPFSPTAVIMTAGAENVTVSFDQSEYSVREGETVVVGVRLSGPVSVQTIVGLLTVDRTAAGSQDYILSDAIVTFAPGEIVRFISIFTVNDSIGESDETFDVVFSTISPNVNIGAIPFSSIVIIDDDQRFSLDCNQFTVSPSGPFQIVCQPRNGELESVECDYNSGQADQPCGLSFSVDFSQSEPGPLNLIITAISTGGQTDTQVFSYTVPIPLTLDCPISAVPGRLTVSCRTNRDLFLPPFCNVETFGVIEPCDLDNIEFNVVDFPPGEYNLTITVVDVLEQTATETVPVFLSEPLFNISCMVNGTIVTCVSSVDGTMVPVSYECSIDGEAAIPCEPPVNTSIVGENLEAGSHSLILLATTPGGQNQQIGLSFIVPECEPLGGVRLVGGSNAMEGRVEVCDGVVWGTVCDDQWDNQDAMVVCRQLGFPIQGAIARTESFFGQGSGPIVLDDVQCTGSETRILDCTACPIRVHDCNHEQDAGVICPLTTSPPMTSAPSGPSSKGNEFVLAFWSNGGQTNIPRPTIALFVTTDDPDPVSFTVDAPNTNIFSEVNDSAVAGQTTTIILPTSDASPTVQSQDIRVFQQTQRNKGIRVKAEDGKTISVYGLNDEDVSTDAFLALPCVEYGENAPDCYTYYVFSADVEGTSNQFSSRFMIIPCEDETEINLIPSHTLEIAADISSTGFAAQVGPDIGTTNFRISLDSLETAMFQSPDDLTGTILESNKPITVLVGHECGQVPEDVESCDILVEQVPPNIAYGKLFLTAPLQFRESGERYRIGSVSNSPNEVTVTCTSEDGTPQTRLTQTLTKGQYAEFDTSGNSEPGPTESYHREYCCIESSLPATVMQYTKGHSVDEISNRGDPAMLYVPPVTQYLNDFTLTTARQVRTSFQGFLSYTISSQFFTDPLVDGRKLLINGSIFDPDSGYSPIFCSDTSAVSGYGAYSALPQGNHAIIYDQAGAGFYPFISGLDIETSFEYPSGFKLEPEGLPVIEIPDRTVSENIGTIEFPIKRIGGDLALPSFIVVSSRDTGTGIGDATAGSDYEPIQPTNDNFPGHRLRYVANSVEPRSADTLRITIIDDDDDLESTETFEVYLVEVRRNAFVFKPIGTVTILDNSDPPMVGFDPIVYDVEERQGYVDLIIRTSADVRLRNGGLLFFTDDGSAVSSGAESDFTATPQANAIPVTFPEDDDPSITVIRVPINNDDIVENTENFFGRLVVDPNINVAGLVITVPDATVNIIDQDIVTLGFDPTSYTVLETEGSASLDVKIFSGQTSMGILVDFTTQSGSAVSPDDFTATTQTLTFGRGMTTQSVNVPIIDDDIVEQLESFNGRLSLGGPTQSSFVTITEPEATVEITSDDDLVTVGFDPASYTVAEGGIAMLRLVLSEPSMSDVTVDLVTVDLSAFAPGDYTTLDTTVTFLAGTTDQIFSVQTNDDSIAEPVETFGAFISNLSPNAIIGVDSATVEINDNTNVLVEFDPTSYEVNENEGVATVRVVKRTQAVKPVSVGFRTESGTATSTDPADFGEVITILTFEPDIDALTVDIPIINDMFYELREVFNVVLDNPGERVLIGATDIADVTILDDDALLVGFDPASYEVNEDAGVVNILVVKVGISEVPITVNLITQDGAAAAPGDYTSFSRTLTFEPDEFSLFISIDIINDDIYEFDEFFIAVLTNPGPNNRNRVTLEVDEAAITILDNDDALVEFDPSIYLVNEGDGSVNLITVSRVLAERPITVDINTQDGSASVPGDYMSVSLKLVFEPEITQISVPVTIVDDGILESLEDFTAILSNPGDRVDIGVDTATISIDDDDPRFALECGLSAVNPSGPFAVECQPRNGELGSLECDYNFGQADEPCGLAFSVNLTQFEPGPLNLTITATSTEGETATEYFTFTVPEPLSLDCSIGGVSGRVTVSCTTSQDLLVPPFCELSGVRVIEPCDLNNIVVNVVDFPPGSYILTISVVDVLEQTATETIELFLSEPLFNASCIVNESVITCTSNVDGTMVPVFYECSIDEGERQSCDPPFSIFDLNLLPGRSYNLNIFASTPGGQFQFIELGFFLPLQ